MLSKWSGYETPVAFLTVLLHLLLFIQMLHWISQHFLTQIFPTLTFITVVFNSIKYFPMKGYRIGQGDRKYLKKTQKNKQHGNWGQKPLLLGCQIDSEVSLLKMLGILLPRTKSAGKCLSPFHLKKQTNRRSAKSKATEKKPITTTTTTTTKNTNEQTSNTTYKKSPTNSTTTTTQQDWCSKPAYLALLCI